jgi:hypothetical protein
MDARTSANARPSDNCSKAVTRLDGLNELTQATSAACSALDMASD